MRKLLLIFALIAVVGLAGCTAKNDFGYGLEQINMVNSRYNATMEDSPKNIEKIDSMLYDLRQLNKTLLSAGQVPFNRLIEFKILILEADKLYIQSQKYGDSGTTKGGFGCKIRPLIVESAHLRNNSALKGYEAVDALYLFVENYPEEAISAGLSSKNAIFLNATFYQLSEDALKDSRVINRFCPKNETLELYKQEFRKNTGFSEDYINNIDYEHAAEIWKKLRRFE